jgi:hypothetical protein
MWFPWSWLAPLTGVVAAPDRALVSAILWAIVALVVGTLVRIALARTETGRPAIRVAKRTRRSDRSAA